MKRNTATVWLLSAGAAVSAALAFAAAPVQAAPPQCRIDQVLGTPSTHQVTLPDGHIRTAYSITLQPFVFCGVNSVLGFSWVYTYKAGNWNAFDYAFMPVIPLTSPDQRVDVTVAVSAMGAREGKCSFVVNKPPKWPFPRYLWTC